MNIPKQDFNNSEDDQVHLDTILGTCSLYHSNTWILSLSTDCLNVYLFFWTMNFNFNCTGSHTLSYFWECNRYRRWSHIEYIPMGLRQRLNKLGTRNCSYHLGMSRLLLHLQSSAFTFFINYQILSTLHHFLNSRMPCFKMNCLISYIVESFLHLHFYNLFYHRCKNQIIFHQLLLIL